MNNNIEDRHLSADKPLLDPNTDRLGYAPFAKHLAKSLIEMVPNDGLVISIHGPWGSGKTTVLNFVLHYLEQLSKTEEITHVSFSPWLFSGNEDLIRKFFDQLITTLSKSESSNKELRKKIARFADLVADTPIPYSSVGKILAKVIAPKEKDIVVKKKEIENLLRIGKRKYLVIIDDIDRLLPDEQRQVFQLIKAVADFPNILYLIAFDKDVAINALEQINGISGRSYLEKIIQVPFELPSPDKVSLRKLLFDNLDKILTGTPQEEFDKSYWNNVYYDGIDFFINSPRDVVRLTNALSVTYPAVKGEVNPIDFIAIEVLRIFVPIAWDVIKNNPQSFTKINDFTSMAFDRKSTNDFFESWMKNLDEKDRAHAKNLLERIFPRIKSNYGYEWESIWRRELKICSPDKFPIYFRLSMPSGVISNAEMKAFLEMTNNSELFGKELLRLSKEYRNNGLTRVSEFLERLEDYTKEIIPKDNIPCILSALFDIGDELLIIGDDQRIIGGFDNDIRVGRIVFQLLQRIPKNERTTLLSQTFQKGRSFAVMENLLVEIGQQHGKWTKHPPSPESEQTIKKEELELLEKIVLGKIRLASSNGDLLKSPQFVSILYRWEAWGTPNEMKQWVQDTIVTEDKLIEFVERFLYRNYSQTMGDVTVKTFYRLDPKRIEPFIDPSKIVERVRKASERTDLTENQKKALNQFLQEYEIRGQGKDPEDTIEHNLK